MPRRGRSARESAGATTVACTEEVTSAEVGKQEKYFGLGHILPMPGG